MMHMYNPTLAERIGIETASVLGDAERLIALLAARNLYISTVESCTGGALVNAITSISGASDVLKDSYITYSNEAKIALGVPPEVIDTYTVYSLETAVAMAKAGLTKSIRADIGVGITGSLTRADPENPNSVPGTVYIGIVRNDTVIERCLEVPEENRALAKLQIVRNAIETVFQILEN